MVWLLPILSGLQLLTAVSIWRRGLQWRFPALLGWSLLLAAQSLLCWIRGPHSFDYQQLWLWTFPLWIVLLGLVIREALLRRLDDYPRKKGFISFLVLTSALVGLTGGAISVGPEWNNLSDWNLQIWYKLVFVAARYVTFAYTFVFAIAILFLRTFASAAATTPNSTRNTLVLLIYMAGNCALIMIHNLLGPSAQQLLFDALNGLGIVSFLAWPLLLTRAGERRPILGEPDTAMQEAREELEAVVRLGSRLWERRGSNVGE